MAFSNKIDGGLRLKGGDPPASAPVNCRTELGSDRLLLAIVLGSGANQLLLGVAKASKRALDPFQLCLKFCLVVMDVGS